MFNKRIEIDEYELGAELYLKHVNESTQVYEDQSNMTKASQEPEEIIEAEENFSVVSKQEEELKSSSKQGEELKSPRASPFLAAIYNIFTLGTNDIRIGFMFYFFLGLLIISGFLYLKPKK